MKMAPKTRAEIQKAYRERKSQSEGVTKGKIKKSRAQIQKEYREREKTQVDSEAFLKQERERKLAAYTPSILPPESALAKRKKENREKAKRFRSKAEANSFQLIKDEDIIEGPRQGECSQGQKEKLVVKTDFKRPTKAARSRKRISRGIATAHKKI